MDDQAAIEQDEPLQAEDSFFTALLEANVGSLQRVLADDFVLVDVRGGGEVDRSALLDSVALGEVRFGALDVVERRLRRYGDVAVVVGRTAMRGDVGGEAFAAESRYTHVFVLGAAGDWRLVAAQGTQVAD